MVSREVRTNGCCQRHCCFDGSPSCGEAEAMRRNRRARPPVQAPSAFAGFRFPPHVILLAVRWYLRYGLSYRDLEELLAERGIDVDHVTLFRWVQRFTPVDRRLRFRAQGYRLGQAVPHHSPCRASRPGGGHHRPRPGPGQRDRGADPGGVPQHRAV